MICFYTNSYWSQNSLFFWTNYFQMNFCVFLLQFSALHMNCYTSWLLKSHQMYLHLPWPTSHSFEEELCFIPWERKFLVILDISSAMKILSWAQKIFDVYLFISSSLEAFYSSRPRTEAAVFVTYKAEIWSFVHFLPLLLSRLGA